jgi:hypothetical protein
MRLSIQNFNEKTPSDCQLVLWLCIGTAAKILDSELVIKDGVATLILAGLPKPNSDAHIARHTTKAMVETVVVHVHTTPIKPSLNGLQVTKVHPLV